jgi:hypothetical protein
MDYRDLSRLAGDPAVVRSTARLVKASLADPRPADREFLAKMAAFAGPERLSTRQAEYLIGLREKAVRRSKVGGYVVRGLVRQLYEASADLSEDAEPHIRSLFDRGPNVAVSEGEWRFICALSRELGIIDEAYIPFR